MKRRYREWLVVLAAAIGVMIFSVAITYVATRLNPEPGDTRTLVGRLLNQPIPEVRTPAEIPLQTAYQNCRARIMSDVGDEVQSISFDNRASRYNGEEGFYQVFMNVYFLTSRQSVYSRCNVSATNGQILEYRLRADQGFLFSF